MPSFVLKPERDRDMYIGWSTVVDNLTWIATRDEALRVLADDTPPGYTPKAGNSAEDRLARADKNGTSALWPETGGYFGGWTDGELMVEQCGLLLRSDLPAYVAALAGGDVDAAYALLKPFDDEDAS